MRLQSHVIISTAASAVGYICTKSLPFSAGILVTGIFLDLDHFVDYFATVGRIKIDIKDFFQRCNELRLKKNYLLFHSVELILVILLVYLLSRNILFLGVLLGFLLHLLLDRCFNYVYPLSFSFIYRWKNNFSVNKVFNVELIEKIKTKSPGKVKLIIGIIFSNKKDIKPVETDLADFYGEIDLRSEIIPFNFTEYYSEEMGDNLLRYWLSFERLILPDDISSIKVKTNKIENKYSINSKRKINIDPGYISGSKLVLASTKNYSHRIYLHRGVYAEVTLIYEHGEFKALPWTYPDYQTDSAKQFFRTARNIIGARSRIPK